MSIDTRNGKGGPTVAKRQQNYWGGSLKKDKRGAARLFKPEGPMTLTRRRREDRKKHRTLVLGEAIAPSLHAGA